MASLQSRLRTNSRLWTLYALWALMMVGLNGEIVAASNSPRRLLQQPGQSPPPQANLTRPPKPPPPTAATLTPSIISFCGSLTATSANCSVLLCQGQSMVVTTCGKNTAGGGDAGDTVLSVFSETGALVSYNDDAPQDGTADTACSGSDLAQGLSYISLPPPLTSTMLTMVSGCYRGTTCTARLSYTIKGLCPSPPPPLPLPPPPASFPPQPPPAAAVFSADSVIAVAVGVSFGFVVLVCFSGFGFYRWRVRIQNQIAALEQAAGLHDGDGEGNLEDLAKLGPIGKAATCAVSLSFLADFYERGGFADKPDLTTGEFVRDCVVPTTAVRRCRLADTLDPKDVWSMDKGMPFYFISHAFSNKFGLLMATLVDHFSVRNPEEVFIWLDVFAINQHDTDSELNEGLTLKQTIRLSECTLVVLDKSALPLSRLWCLYEISETPRQDLRLLTQGFALGDIALAIKSIDVEKARIIPSADSPCQLRTHNRLCIWAGSGLSGAPRGCRLLASAHTTGM